jgi:thiamine-phosphate pyrophosphorylase
MTHRQPQTSSRKCLPTIWLMTDSRFGHDLLPAIQRLPLRSGVIFRHYELAEPERHRLFRRVRRICRQRGHVLILAGGEPAAIRWRADGFHGRLRGRKSNLLHSAPVHDRKELNEALRNSADLILISPLFATRSHPDERPMRQSIFNMLADQSGQAAVIALGGMTAQRARLLNRKRVHGWAAIDAFRK